MLYVIGWLLGLSVLLRDLNGYLDEIEESDRAISEFEMMGGSREVARDILVLASVVMSAILWPVWAITWPVKPILRKVRKGNK